MYCVFINKIISVGYVVKVTELLFFFFCLAVTVTWTWHTGTLSQLLSSCVVNSCTELRGSYGCGVCDFRTVVIVVSFKFELRSIHLIGIQSWNGWFSASNKLINVVFKLILLVY